MTRFRQVEIKLGDLVHDLISGFAGTVTTRVESLHGSVEWLVESERTPNTPSEVRRYHEKEIGRLKVLGNALEEEKVIPPRGATKRR